MLPSLPSDSGGTGEPSHTRSVRDRGSCRPGRRGRPASGQQYRRPSHRRENRGRLRFHRHARARLCPPQTGPGRDVAPGPAPARETWITDPAKVFDNLYFVGTKIPLLVGADHERRHHPHRYALRIRFRRGDRRRHEEARARSDQRQIRDHLARSRRPCRWSQADAGSLQVAPRHGRARLGVDRALRQSVSERQAQARHRRRWTGRRSRSATHP